MLYSALHDITTAEAIFRTALCYGPADPFALNSYGVLLNGIGEPLAGARLLDRSLLLQPGNAEIHSNLLLTQQYDLARSAADLKRGHLRWYRRHGASNQPLAEAPDNPDPERRLQIGYVSADFGQHPVGFFLIGVIPRHDRSRVRNPLLFVAPS